MNWNLIYFRDEQSLQSGVTKLEIETIAIFDDHNSLVWRVCWNLPGTILSSSGDDGCVRMFKSKWHTNCEFKTVFLSRCFTDTTTVYNWSLTEIFILHFFVTKYLPKYCYFHTLTRLITTLRKGHSWVNHTARWGSHSQAPLLFIR